jgi:ABC-type transporter Mla MlaB component
MSAGVGRGVPGGARLDGVTLRLWGEVDYQVVSLDGPAVLAGVSRGNETLRIEASRVTFLDSAALSFLVRVVGCVDRAVLVGASGAVHEMLSMTGTLPLFDRPE